MERPSIEATAAVFQAGTTVSTYLASALAMIEEREEQLDELCVSPDYAHLIAELVRAQTADFNNCSLVSAIDRLADAVERAALSGAPRTDPPAP